MLLPFFETLPVKFLTPEMASGIFLFRQAARDISLSARAALCRKCSASDSVSGPSLQNPHSHTKPSKKFLPYDQARYDSE